MRKSEKALKKLERQEKRKGRGVDADLDWLINNQDAALQILAGESGPQPLAVRVY